MRLSSGAATGIGDRQGTLPPTDLPAVFSLAAIRSSRILMAFLSPSFPGVWRHGLLKGRGLMIFLSRLIRLSSFPLGTSPGGRLNRRNAFAPVLLNLGALVVLLLLEVALIVLANLVPGGYRW